jgi:MoxR-like ATPase
MPRVAASPGSVVTIPTPPGAPTQVHVFSAAEINALDTALAAKRALLVRGEPGTGKTQLARAAAVALERPFVSFTVDSRTEARDLLWHLDAVRRLAEAQVYGALVGHRATATTAQSSGATSPDDVETAALDILRGKLDIARFVQPRALWWGLNWRGAAAQATMAESETPVQYHNQDPANGVVVLIDEIDKGDSDVPNGLLEALGSGEFGIPGRHEPIRPDSGTVPPLVIITTNEERILPDAFVRRCAVLTIQLPPEDDAPALIAYLVERGRAHFTTFGANRSPDAKDPLEEAARLVVKDRADARRNGWRPLPGQAEFIDLLRAVFDLASGDPARAVDLLALAAPYISRKNAGAGASPLGAAG